MKRNKTLFLVAVFASAISALILCGRTVANAQATLGNFSSNLPPWLDEFRSYPANRDFTPKSGKASVYVCRRGFAGSAVMLHVFLDGQVWEPLANNTFQLMTVSPGQHSVVVAGGTRRPFVGGAYTAHFAMCAPSETC